jgi:hypothetical protein
MGNGDVKNALSVMRGQEAGLAKAEVSDILAGDGKTAHLFYSVQKLNANIRPNILVHAVKNKVRMGCGYVKNDLSVMRGQEAGLAKAEVQSPRESRHHD